MISSITRMKEGGLIQDCDFELPKDDADDPSWDVFKAFGRPGRMNSSSWFNNTKEKLDNGFIAICNINMKKREHERCEADHWVLIVGYDEIKIPLNPRSEESIGSRIEQVVYVSCSAVTTPDLDIVKKEDFLYFIGGYNAIFVKP